MDQDRSGAEAATTLAGILSSKVRANLLIWIAGRLDTPFSLTDASRSTGLAVSSLQHECYKLERLGILKGRRSGQSRLYEFQVDDHASRALVNLVSAVAGIEFLVEQILEEAGQLDIAAIVSTGSEVQRPILIVIGSASLESLAVVQHRVSLLLGIGSDGLELAYFDRAEWSPVEPQWTRLLSRMAGGDVHPVVGSWPPSVHL